MFTFIIIAAMTVIGILVMMGRLNMRRFLGYPNLVDITCSVLFLMLFAGTFSGMVVAGFASLFMSCMLGALRSFMGAERLAFKRGRFNMPTLYWRNLTPSECRPHWLQSLVLRILRPAPIAQ